MLETLILGSQHLLHETGDEQARPEIQMGLKCHNTIGKLLACQRFPSRNRVGRLPPSVPPRTISGRSAHGGSGLSGKTHDPDAPGDDRSPSPIPTNLPFTTPITRGRNRLAPGSTPPRTVSKLQSHLLIADWRENKVHAPRRRYVPIFGL